MRQAVLESYPSEEPAFRTRISWYGLSLPIKKGEALGELLIEDGSGRVLEKIPLVSVEELSSFNLGARLFQAVLVLGGAALLLIAFKRFK